MWGSVCLCEHVKLKSSLFFFLRKVFHNSVLIVHFLSCLTFQLSVIEIHDLSLK